MVYWSLLHVYVPLKGNSPLCSGEHFQRSERKMEGLHPNCHAIGMEEQKLRESSLFTSLLHRPRLLHQSPLARQHGVDIQ